MRLLRPIAKTLTVVLALAFSAPAMARDDASEIDALFARLADPDEPDARQVAADIRRHWAQSGSATLDLLLRRGRDAIAEGDLVAAVEHFTALTDYAPDFAEAWHGRATAFFLMDRPGVALGDLRHTLALEPRHFEAWAGIGVILQGLDRPEAAYEAFERSLTINPHAPAIAEAIERLDKEVNGRQL